MSKNFAFTGKVWKYEGPAGWYFVYVDEKVSEEIRQISSGVKKVGFGFIPVHATIGETSWKTTLFPTKEGPYLVAIKAGIRKKERVGEGDEVKISFNLL